MKKYLSISICILLLSAFPLLPVSADTGPKPSVTVTLKNAGSETCYGTLLSKKPNSGPFVAWDGDEEHLRQEQEDVPGEVVRAFLDYEDRDGYYFLQNSIRKVETELYWGYYPPESFKLLLYFPETGNFAVSGICERYAFDSYFTVDMAEYEAGGNSLLNIRKAHRWGQSLLSLAARILITVAIEIVIALLFRIRDKKSLLFILAVNLLTQIGLNLALNLIVYRFGIFGLIAGYILLELAIFILEAALYSTLMRKLTDSPRPAGIYVIYALAANAASFAAGIVLSFVIPKLF